MVIKSPLKNVTDHQQLAQVLGMDPKKFTYVLRNSDTRIYYHSFSIPKKGGSIRNIDKPIKGLALAQDRLFAFLESHYVPKKHVKGYVRGESFLSNARVHQKPKWVLNMDIQDFFGSITFPRVYGLFLSSYFGCNPIVATCLARICCYQNRLPQGAKTSPIIANMIAHNLDKELIVIARKHNVKYTRYADDITFSSTSKNSYKKLTQNQAKVSGDVAVQLSDEINAAFAKAKFTINPKKTRIQFTNERMEVTGLVVNEKPNIRRRDIARLRMKLHSAKKFGADEAAKLWLEPNSNAKFFWQHIEGWLAFIKQVKGSRDKVLVNFCQRALDQNKNLANWIKEEVEMGMEYDVFISHATEDKDRVRHLHEACLKQNLTVFFDEASIEWGNSIVEKINQGLKTAKFFVPVISKSFAEKSWTNKELNAFINSSIATKSRLLPISLGDFDIGKEYPFIGDILYKKWPIEPEAQTVFLEQTALNLKERVDKYISEPSA